MNANGDGWWNPLVYYAPVANAHWKGLNTSDFTLPVDSTRVPIHAPGTSEKTEFNFCVPNDASSLSFRWRQMNFGPGTTDQWILGDVKVKVQEDEVLQEEAVGYVGQSV